MKKRGLLVLILVLLSLLIVNAISTTTKLNIGDSIEINGKNISLVATDTKQDKAVVCVNNKKDIIRQDSSKIINDVTVILKDVSFNAVDLKLSYDCIGNCYCSEECSNLECFPRECSEDSDCDDSNELTIDSCELGRCIRNFIEEGAEEEIEEEKVTTAAVVEQEAKEEKITMSTIITLFLVIILIVVAVILYLKKFR